VDENGILYGLVSNALRKPIVMGGKANVQWPSTSGSLGRG
jgi:hypothetical protein